MHFSMLHLPCQEAFVCGREHKTAHLFLYGSVHAHDFRIVLTRQMVETLRESCENYLRSTQDSVTDPEDFARSVINEVCAPVRIDIDAT
jgi:hypothetical protein